MKVKLIIQIPCLNEREQLRATIEALPRRVEGISVIEVLVVDDGSHDGTADLARSLGVHQIVRFPRRKGLAAAHMAGLDAALRLGADIVVNTDADNQYCADDIAGLVRPIVEGRANVVIGDRQTDQISEFSPLKRLLQRWGSAIVRRASGTNVADTTSGFRSYDRKALQTVFVHNQFTYTLEAIIQAAAAGLVVENAVVRTNRATRKSRLFSSIPQYVRRSGAVILRAYGMYWPLQTFGMLALGFALFGFALGIRFLFYYLRDPLTSSHVQSLQVGVGAVIMALIIGLMAQLGDLLAANRRLNEEILLRIRRLDAAQAATDREQGKALEGIESTGAMAWTARGTFEAAP
jgi:glycosyltransferase involved in cell wall biosynthesis